MITKPKGTKDISGQTSWNWNTLENKLKSISAVFNIQEIRTPIFESKSLFVSTVGEGTDVVNKELYEFNDKGDREMALRPEGTAGVIRSFIEDKMYVNNDITKLFYLGQMFRYERPQNGRQRQFNQFGIELLSKDEIPYLDFEAISMAQKIIDELELKDIKLVINNLGDGESRTKYNIALNKHFEERKEELCDTCKERIGVNPMRIIDCKVCSKEAVVKKAPMIYAYISQASKTYFEEIKKYLDNAEIKYEEDATLVRGLGYYTGLVFEFVNTNENQGAKSTIIGGGHYSNLVKHLGGPDIKGVGFAIGMERLMIALELSGYEFKQRSIDAMIINVAEDNTYANNLLTTLRTNDIKADISYRKFKNAFKDVESTNAKAAIIIGNTEIKESKVVIKWQDTKEEQKVLLKDVVKIMKEKV